MMQREPSRSARSPGTRKATGRIGSIRKPDRSLWRDLRDTITSKRFGWSLTVGIALTLLASVVAVWATEQPLVAVGRVMSQTWTARLAFHSVDHQRTEQEQESARQRQPRSYTADEVALDSIRRSLIDLPTILAGITDVDRVDADLRRQFRLNEERMKAIGAYASPDRLSMWTEYVDQLMSMLERRPILDEQTWQARLEGRNTQIKLVTSSGAQLINRDSEPINLDDSTQLGEEIEKLIRIAGFAPMTGDLGPVGESIKQRLTIDARPTFLFDAAGTNTAQEEAVAAVQPVRENIAKGQRIFSRGDVLDQTQFRLLNEERAQYRTNTEPWRVWLGRLGITGVIGLLVALLMGYVATFVPRISSNPSRLIWVGVVVLAAQVFACVLTVFDPRYIVLTSMVPTVLVAVLLSIAYDRRTAMAIGALTALIVCVSLTGALSMYTLMLVGMGAAVWRLPEIRDRQSLVTMSLWVAGSVMIGALVTGILWMPLDTTVLRQTGRDALLAGFGGLLIGGVTLFLLPVIERAFDITTSLTLIELRDPKQPLLRELQQRAPGTYNHSLNVASIAETAADAIGANGLMTYVGALYHDIGKMNKPEYFVENQSGGPSRHDKLSPAMSLLVIVGHVKDGMEIAREYGLPKVLRHFIEAHHGTTLVEYFYNQARKQAKVVADADGQSESGAGELEDERLPDEVDYRYPGPKPRTKEVAILMLSDAVESATRSLPEPTPSRIESLVHTLADRRLMDGQFDECDLTFRELRTIVDSLSKSVTSIYHGRIVYPGTERAAKPRTDKAPERERTA
jgi:cyclic-di-AMP phosphodiesterase PgpH